MDNRAFGTLLRDEAQRRVGQGPTLVEAAQAAERLTEIARLHEIGQELVFHANRTFRSTGGHFRWSMVNIPVRRRRFAGRFCGFPISRRRHARQVVHPPHGRGAAPSFFRIGSGSGSRGSSSIGCSRRIMRRCFLSAQARMVGVISLSKKIRVLVRDYGPPTPLYHLTKARPIYCPEQPRLMVPRFVSAHVPRMCQL